MKSTDRKRNTSARKFARANPGCPNRSLLWIAFVLYSIDVVSDFADGYKRTDSSNEFALLGDTFKLSCVAKTSTPLRWDFTPYGSNVSEPINDNGQADSNLTHACKVVSEGSDRTALMCDTVGTSIAGLYECHDIGETEYMYSIDVIVTDPHPICHQSKRYSSTVCRFLYVGKVAPDFIWSTKENSTSWNKSVTVSDSSTIGSLHLIRYLNPARRWRCETQVDTGDSLVEIFSPVNYAAVIGEHIRLNCSKQNDDTGYWFRNAHLSADEVLIYHKKMVRNGLFSVDESVPGRSDLLFILSQGTSGRYGCDSVDGTHTAQVIMTDSQLSCSWEPSGKYANASCSIRFGGNWSPVIVWSDSSGKTLVADTTTIPSNLVTSLLIVQLTGAPDELYSVTCSVKFREEDRPPKTTAQNIPKIVLDTCQVTIDASGSGLAAGNKSGKQLNNEETAMESAGFYQSAEGYSQTESRYRIVLLGDRVELDCFADTSRSLEWYFTPNGIDVSELINGSSQANSTVTDACRIVSEDVGHATLIIDRVLVTHAGRYECKDGDKKYKLTVDLTVFDPNAACDKDPDSSSIVCPFHYAGIITPELEWLTSDNSTFCNEFANDSSTIGSLRINGYKDPSRCYFCEAEKGDTVGETVSPLNYAAVEGTIIRLNCSTKNDDTRYWLRNRPLSGDDILIYHKGDLKNRMFTVYESVPRRSDLILTVWNRTSGRYGCDSGYTTHTAEVILTDSHPTCSGETKGRVVNASCSIEFSGNWPPVIDWTDATRKTLVADTTTIPNHRVTSFLIVQLSGDPHELYSVACTVKFREAEKPPKTTAKNIPKIPSDICSVPIKAPDYDDNADETDSPEKKGQSAADPGAAAGAIEVGQEQNIEQPPAADKIGAPKRNEGMAEVDNPNIGSGREIFVLLQVFLALVAAIVGLGQF